jgi:cell division protein FtsL
MNKNEFNHNFQMNRYNAMNIEQKHAVVREQLKQAFSPAGLAIIVTVIVAVIVLLYFMHIS